MPLKKKESKEEGMEGEEKERKPVGSCQGAVNLSWIKARDHIDFPALKN